MSATEALLRTMIETNGITDDTIASILFSSTPDLTADYPAKAARSLGLTQTALMGFQEIDKPEGLASCIRILIHWNTEKSLNEIQHIFLRDAVKLRPDLGKTIVEGEN